MKKLIIILLSPLFAIAQTEQGYDKKFVKLKASYPELLAFVKQVKTKDIQGKYYSQGGLKTKFGQDGTYILHTTSNPALHKFERINYHYYIKNDTVFMMEVYPNKGGVIELK